ncbi:MAG: TaqI-like C-terminal specificity domain-containing protein, partial [Bacteroidales bacterium]|nr:TaqI-like C-terminal specificity domain-containing protein [Bacteroidales bacterium]
KEQLKQIRHFYFSASSRKQKIEFQKKDKEYREEISKLLTKEGWKTNVADQIASFDPYDQNHFANWFEPEWMFGNEVKDGFDIVIGNPPYVVTKKGTYSNYKWEGDLYTIFFELSVKILLNQKGILSFITPRFFLFNQINFEMRKYILNELNILLMAECNPFDAVTENEITILTVEKAKSSKIDFFTHQNEAMQFLNSVNKDWIKTNKLLEINPYLTEKIFFVLQKIKGNNKILSEISISKRGAEIGKNDLRAVIKGKSILLGYDVNRFCVTPTDAKIDTGHKEYQRLINIFKHTQLLLLRRVSKDLIAAVTDNPIAFSKNLYGIIPNKNINPHFLSALLNSKLLNFYYKKKFSTKKEDVFPEIQTYLYEQLPIKNANEKEQRLVINIVDQILTAKKSNPKADTSNLEKQIDELVYKLYDLTEEEIKIIEGNV